MPIYEYACEKCESEFEVEQRITDSPVKSCPELQIQEGQTTDLEDLLRPQGRRLVFGPLFVTRRKRRQSRQGRFGRRQGREQIGGFEIGIQEGLEERRHPQAVVKRQARIADGPEKEAEMRKAKARVKGGKAVA